MQALTRGPGRCSQALQGTPTGPHFGTHLAGTHLPSVTNDPVCTPLRPWRDTAFVPKHTMPMVFLRACLYFHRNKVGGFVFFSTCLRAGCTGTLAYLVQSSQLCSVLLPCVFRKPQLLREHLSEDLGFQTVPDTLKLLKLT